MPLWLSIRLISVKTFFVAFVMILMVGCGQAINQVKRVETLKPIGAEGPQKILLMPLDVELSLLTASGLLEPKADWTKAAKGFMRDSIIVEMDNNNVQLLDYFNENEAPESISFQLEKLHEVVGGSIVLNRSMPLPSRPKDAVWTLGVDSKVLKEKTGANYALFIYMRDSYASGGRVAMTILLAAATGVVAGGGQQQGFASLVDLESGDIVWFNQVSSTSGDLRQVEPASTSIKLLLKGMPTAN